VNDVEPLWETNTPLQKKVLISDPLPP
jgi:hypothetical protein